MERTQQFSRIDPFKGIDHESSTLDKPLVLLVDSDKDNLLLLAWVLQKFNCALIAAAQGKAAISIAQIHQPNLILLEILLPDLDGLEVITQLRQIPETKQITIIAVTALAKAEDKQKVLSAGGDDYISKPYMLEELETLIEHYL
ncbi:MAG: response regulator [Cyanobacteria bacterium SW_6_48_11]|jgi:CheY-like chemotaxis protein|nr:MAG: response regulator [Cyanobacteria bacterium QH_2_48_84]PSO76539.1 MAG: response regulator [Cyanobacteria bacterium QS_4_48_99]PSO82864.1 MAG: response regulator [Cyanobacteria bacterium QS_5_48_63]PSO85842.1 MAG: response regulator [Cyanobacteria bacterium QS_3_48_167]PSO90740.1 MAG: response regulator [Cyanobacteria bacterium QS_6_48_18]PSO91980.1 MAG: response regulator [Cyanobacteria bacterium QS_9_48_30]PSO97819.1 MAG: response regulator [Cyanobacteria bacterium SW_6_48_11]PSP051